MDLQPPTVGLSIRSAAERDLETLLSIQREAAIASFAHVFDQSRYPFPSDEIRELWREALSDPDVEIYVAENEGRATGCAAVAGDFLRSLYVLPAQQGSGVGSTLHDLALERLRARGCTWGKLWTLEENWPARRFYERRGWELTKETRVVPFPPNPTDVQYARDLSVP
jgi:GNAT superfamily N-acetyltransferase